MVTVSPNVFWQNVLASNLPSNWMLVVHEPVGGAQSILTHQMTASIC